jgi:general secretion pathway protein D
MMKNTFFSCCAASFSGAPIYRSKLRARAFSAVGLVASALFVGGCANSLQPMKQDSGRAIAPRAAASQPALKAASGAASGRVASQGVVVESEQRSGEIYQLGNNQLVRPAQRVEPAVGQDGLIQLNLENGDVRELVRNIIADELKENVVVDPRVTGTVTVRTPKGIRRSELIPTLETLLKSVGASLAKDGSGLWRVFPAAEGIGGILAPRLGPSRGEGMSVQILPVRHIGAVRMKEIMLPFAKGGDAAVRVDEFRNILFLTGTEIEVRRLLEISTMFDVDVLAGMSFLLYPLKNAEAKTVLADWEKLFPNNTNPFTGLLKISAIDRMNALFLASPQSNTIVQARELLERLDKRGDGGSEPQLFVYFLKNTQAAKLQPILQQALSGQRTNTVPGATVAPGQQASTINTPPSAIPGQPNLLPGNNPLRPNQPATQTPVQPTPQNQARPVGAPGTPGSALARSATIVADQDRNALLVVSTPAEYAAVEAVIKRLDLPPKQVAIEVQIAQVQLTGDFAFGLQTYFQGYLDSKANRFNSSNGSGGIQQALGSAASAFTYTWKKTDAIKAILELSEGKSQVRIVSQPTLITLENQKTAFESGRQVSVRTQTQNSTGTTGSVDSFQYVSTGISISVTPRVSGENVFLEIQQDISDTSPSKFGSQNPDITKNSSTTNVMVSSGDTMLLGGIFTDKGSNNSSGLPLASSIPIVGGLFGRQEWNADRFELALLITPRILPNGEEGNDIIDELRQRLKGIEDFVPAVGVKELPSNSDAKKRLKVERAASEAVLKP